MHKATAPRWRKKVVFPSRNVRSSSTFSQILQSPEDILETQAAARKSGRNMEQQGDFEASPYLDHDTMSEIWTSEATQSQLTAQIPQIPDYFLVPPILRDPLTTESSILQDEIVQDCLPLLNGANRSHDGVYNSHGVSGLYRANHIEFLHGLFEQLPAGYVAYDASRLWLLYWGLTGLSLLDQDVTKYRDRLVQTLKPMQNRDGGFGGGFGQMSHCAVSYAAILCLAMVGGDEALELVDRRVLWRWLGSVKQADGGFTLSVGGEEDVRGAYCAMVVIALLRLPLDLPQDSPARKAGLETLLDGLPEWLSRCQTYEGGIAGAPGTEAHGGYAFCAVACLCIMGDPSIMMPKYFDLPLLTSWISKMQYAPEGGFAGRTNKLVDACYSHWVGGCCPFIEEALQCSLGKSPLSIDSLMDREGLARYIMCCSQSAEGGFRDKPSKYADGQHTCYALAGLSAIQHRRTYRRRRGEDVESTAEDPLDAAFRWSPSARSIPGNNLVDGAADNVYDEQDVILPIHPVFAIPYPAVENMREYFGRKVGF
ncbi:CAAX farnesyltransferase (FTase) subunit beta [Agyrium rufum]|nr:CAAX farnesyltransferase (FTase) subunit beta [Agyrium rufum]